MLQPEAGCLPERFHMHLMWVRGSAGVERTVSNHFVACDVCMVGPMSESVRRFTYFCVACR